MKIIFNGKSVNTSVKYAHELGEGNIIVNGYEIHSPYELKENDKIVIYKKGEIPNKEQFASMIGARNNIDGNVLLNAHVAICGLGGLGSNIAVMLSRLGVGNLLLIDFDTVDITNINRQYYTLKHIGMLKTDAICDIIKDINPYLNIKTINIKIDENNIKELFDGYDIICEAFDNPYAKALLVNYVLENHPHKKLVCGSGMAGLYSSNLIQTKRVMKNLYICGDETNEAKIGEGLTAPRVSICAGHEANMILRLINGMEDV